MPSFSNSVAASMATISIRECAKSGHGRPDGGADDDLLRDRRVEHTLLTELFHQPARDFERAVVETDVLAEQEDAIVALHFLAERLVERVAHGEHRHQAAPSPA